MGAGVVIGDFFVDFFLNIFPSMHFFNFNIIPFYKLIQNRRYFSTKKIACSPIPLTPPPSFSVSGLKFNDSDSFGITTCALGLPQKLCRVTFASKLTSLAQ